MGTVAKALDLLHLFTTARPEIGLSDLARLSGTNKATCFRLMGALAGHGLVEQTQGGRAYRLGPAVLRLAALREAHVPTRAAALPILQRLADATGETAHLSILTGDALTTLAFAYAAEHGTKVMMEDADILPWHATASGMVTLAHLPDARVQAILAAPLARITERTETDAGVILGLLPGIRAGGVAQVQGTFEADVRSMAVPLFDAGQRCLGALAVAAPAARMTDTLQSRIRHALTRAGLALTAAWGGQVPQALADAWAAE